VKQLLQNVSTGEITVEEVPLPARNSSSLLMATHYSVISAGTERAVLEVGRASLVGKARARPDLARKVVDSAREEGLASTYAKVRGRLGEPNALGYSSCGEVLEACDDAPAAPGDLVACAGAGHASHAEVVAVPRNLCARVPEGVEAADAAYGTVASIALHGVRLADVGLGDVVAVIGLGLVGQLTLELVAAAGAVPLGIDLDAGRVALAREAGFSAFTDAAQLESEARRLTSRRGVDSVLVTAASKTSEPLSLATALARDRARVVVVGDVLIESPRAPLFGKELRLVVSRSYGPGRYDPVYERDGVDYPASYVRWTEGRNLAEVLRLMAEGKLRPSRLTTQVVDLDEGASAYALLESEEPSLGILLRYGRNSENKGTQSVRLEGSKRPRRPLLGRARPRVGVIGAGAFARGVLMPALRSGADIRAIATASGLSAKSSAKRFGASLATTDAREVLGSREIDAVVIATRHDTHASYVVEALEAGKHVFVEKPLALDEEGLRAVEQAAARADGVLMVGFNRRFAPLARVLRDALSDRGPIILTYRVNAGRLPRSHWTHDPDVGGGRVVGEVCHFVDFAAFLAGRPVTATSLAVGGGSEPREDNLAATLSLSDGSIATIVYSALGDPALEKERVEVFGEAGAGVLDDFRSLHLFLGGQESVAEKKRDKGHKAEMAAFLGACKSGEQPWPVVEMVSVMRATFDIRDDLRASASPARAKA
jgi:predicted dehydrogenase/threonine dehydrogenase-like Zn-dependent dehydrogenase